MKKKEEIIVIILLCISAGSIYWLYVNQNKRDTFTIDRKFNNALEENLITQAEAVPCVSSEIVAKEYTKKTSRPYSFIIGDIPCLTNKSDLAVKAKSQYGIPNFEKQKQIHGSYRASVQREAPEPTALNLRYFDEQAALFWSPDGQIMSIDVCKSLLPIDPYMVTMDYSWYGSYGTGDDYIRYVYFDNNNKPACQQIFPYTTWGS